MSGTCSLFRPFGDPWPSCQLPSHDPHSRAVVWVRGETFKTESETADLWQPKWNENHTVLIAAIHTLDRDAGPLEGAGAGSCGLGIVKTFQGESCCGLQRNGLRGCEGGDCGEKCLWRKVVQAWKQADTAESHIGGGDITMASLCSYASISSWMMERLTHQMPATLNSGVGTHPGCPFMWLMCQITEKAPKQGSPISSWTGRAMEKDWPRGLLIASYKSLEKRLQEGHNTCSWSGLCPWTQAARVYTSQPAIPSSCSTFSGAELPHEKKSYVYACRVASVISNFLWPCRLGPARLLCQGSSPGKNTGTYWQILVIILF